jgi:hypothetical protein
MGASSHFSIIPLLVRWSMSDVSWARGRVHLGIAAPLSSSYCNSSRGLLVESGSMGCGLFRSRHRPKGTRLVLSRLLGRVARAGGAPVWIFA